MCGWPAPPCPGRTNCVLHKVGASATGGNGIQRVLSQRMRAVRPSIYLGRYLLSFKVGTHVLLPGTCRLPDAQVPASAGLQYVLDHWDTVSKRSALFGGNMQHKDAVALFVTALVHAALHLQQHSSSRDSGGGGGGGRQAAEEEAEERRQVVALYRQVSGKLREDGLASSSLAALATRCTDRLADAAANTAVAA